MLTIRREIEAQAGVDLGDAEEIGEEEHGRE
jgi:hypothetical protein